jgi:hypothetical protein
MQTQPSINESLDLTYPLLSIAIDLIHKSAWSTNPMTVEKERSKGRQAKTKERLGDCKGLNDSHSKLLPGCSLILSIMSLTIDNGRQNAILHKILSCHWLL